MTEEGGPERMQEVYPEFNESLLFFIPKKENLVSIDGIKYQNPDGVRPLNVTNTYNRLLASAVRLIIEPQVGARISFSQRGFTRSCGNVRRDAGAWNRH